MPKTSRQSSPKSKARKKAKKQPALDFSERVLDITDALLPREWAPDLDLLRRVIKRTREVNEPRLDSFSPTSAQQKTPRFKIATISTNLGIAHLQKREDSGYQVWVVDPMYRDLLRKEFLKHLRQAGKAGAKLVCFNELAYPTPLDEPGDVAFENQI